ncbi:hypothetical protein M0L20_18310 [Spirosoma sp. RP8]|uniref:Uncharacterized protein n=1 Tax=Spirosoma liriopis TaxID=2937440 RepID=A0ABT0HNS3_9BACT|nr:hypothetical protein [Spirosoma liriopis]MCK8493826.1 hypothetical protein [Spirosoma liriopis]
MWWKKVKSYDKQILRNANLDPIPYAKDRLKVEFAKALLEPLPVSQTDLGDSVEFQAEAILLSVPQWQAIKTQLEEVSGLATQEQQAVIARIIATVEEAG